MLTDEEITEWTAALRSGEYEQGTGRLLVHAEDGSLTYCCLGVLADLRVKKGRGEWVETDSDSPRYWDGESNWLGMLPETIIPQRVQNDSLVYANDTLGGDFHQIANMVERLHKEGKL